MKLATASTYDPPVARAATLDPGMLIRHVDPARAERECRKIVSNIEGCESVAELEEYMEAESVSIDALYLFDVSLSERVEQAASDALIFLEAATRHVIPPATGANGERPANPGNSAIANPKETKMFKIATHEGGGSQGPWMSWSSNGSAMKSIPPKSWVLREKDANGMTAETVIPAFANGCVLDLDSLKLGWEKDGGQGQAPERRWAPDISTPMPRPDDSQKAQGGFAWSAALSVRCAIGGGQAATWEQGAFGAYEGFSRLARLIEAQYPGDGTLPLVKMTGVETIRLKSGSANIPLLTIERWVPRPDCLKADAPTIATQPAATPAAPAPAPAPAPAQNAVPEDASF